MKTTGRTAIALSLSLIFVSCVQPVHHSTRDEEFLAREAGKTPWRRVAVMPFDGPPEFRRVAAEWLAFRVRGLGLFDVVDPSLAEIELGRKGLAFGEAGIAAEEARRAGLALGVDGIVFGSTAHTPPQGGLAFPTAGASLLDTATGKVVATVTRSKSMRTADNRERVAAAVDGVVEDLTPVFHALAGKPWTPPPKKEGGDGEPRGAQ